MAIINITKYLRCSFQEFVDGWRLRTSDIAYLDDAVKDKE